MSDEMVKAVAEAVAWVGRSLTLYEGFLYLSKPPQIVVIMLDWKGPLTVGGILISWYEFRALKPTTLQVPELSSSQTYRALKRLINEKWVVVEPGSRPVKYRLVSPCAGGSIVSYYQKLLEFMRTVDALEGRWASDA